MARTRLWILGIAFVAVFLFGSACGGDDSSKSSATAAATASGSSATSAATASGGAKGTPTSAATAAASGLADLQNASKHLDAIDFKVTYESSMADSKGTPTVGSMTMAHKGKKNLIVIDGGFLGGVSGDNSTGKTTIIDDGTSTFFCTSQQKTCIKSKAGGTATNPLIGFADSFRADNLVKTFSKNGYEVKSVAGQKIAGRDGKCYEGKGPDGSGTICLDSKTGILLLIDGTSTVAGQKVKTVLKAKEATDSPSDADFNPPYPVQSIPGQ